MNIPRYLAASACTLLAGVAMAQAPSKPLNLKLPPSDLPVSSATSARAASAAPGVYYGDTSGRMGNETAERNDNGGCDDYTYNQPQVHGSVSTGVMSGSRVGTSSYNAGQVNISKAFGSCDDPGGGMSISIGAGSENFHGHGRGR